MRVFIADPSISKENNILEVFTCQSLRGSFECNGIGSSTGGDQEKKTEIPEREEEALDKLAAMETGE